jgi:hypothetical protein
MKTIPTGMVFLFICLLSAKNKGSVKNQASIMNFKAAVKNFINNYLIT